MARMRVVQLYNDSIESQRNENRINIPVLDHVHSIGAGRSSTAHVFRPNKQNQTLSNPLTETLKTYSYLDLDTHISMFVHFIVFAFPKMKPH